MTPPREVLDDLRAHLTLSRDLLSLIEQEGSALRAAGTLADTHHTKQALFERFSASLAHLRQHRVTWQQQSPHDRRAHTELTALLKQNQEVTMRALVLDRENEQALLRRGLLPPRAIPAVQQQRPHFVGDLYRRTASR